MMQAQLQVSSASSCPPRLPASGAVWYSKHPSCHICLGGGTSEEMPPAIRESRPYDGLAMRFYHVTSSKVRRQPILGKGQSWAAPQSGVSGVRSKGKWGRADDGGAEERRRGKGIQQLPLVDKIPHRYCHDDSPTSLQLVKLGMSRPCGWMYSMCVWAACERGGVL